MEKQPPYPSPKPQLNNLGTIIASLIMMFFIGYFFFYFQSKPDAYQVANSIIKDFYYGEIDKQIQSIPADVLRKRIIEDGICQDLLNDGVIK